MKVIAWGVWFSLLLSIFFYLGAAHYVGPIDPDGGHDYSALRWALVGAGLLLTAASFVLPRLLIGRAPFLSAYIIRWVLADAIAVMGLLLYFLGEPMPAFYAFIVWAIVLDLLAAPTDRAQARYAIPSIPRDS